MTKEKSKRKKFKNNIFNYATTKDGKVFIYWQGKLAKIIKGKDARKFLKRISSSSLKGQQMVMAKITGNFKRGNERCLK